MMLNIRIISEVLAATFLNPMNSIVPRTEKGWIVCHRPEARCDAPWTKPGSATSLSPWAGAHQFIRPLTVELKVIKARKMRSECSNASLADRKISGV